MYKGRIRYTVDVSAKCHGIMLILFIIIYQKTIKLKKRENAICTISSHSRQYVVLLLGEIICTTV
jgi:hypothetical protein